MIRMEPPVTQATPPASKSSGDKKGDAFALPERNRIRSVVGMNPWFRFYHEALDDPKVQKLSLELFRDWVNILCLTCRNDGVLPCLAAVSFALRKSDADTSATLDYLMAVGLIDRLRSGKLRPHNWDSRQFKSDNSYERVKRFRNVSRNGVKRSNETAPDTDQIQNRTDTPVVPVSGHGVGGKFEAFWQSYPRKKEKGEARKVWQQINPQNGLVEKILAAVEEAKRSVDWMKDNGKYIPYPVRWLKKGCWDDEVGQAAGLPFKSRIVQ